MPEFRDSGHTQGAFLSVIAARTASPDWPAALATALRTSDAVRVEGAFPAARIAALRIEAELAHAAGRFVAARVGRARDMVPALRGDELCWCTPRADAPATRALLDELEALRIALDRELLLGARAVEAHFALYGAGARYARHLDRVAVPAHAQGRAEDGVAGGGRVLSLVLYLNDAWDAADGGALRLHAPDGVPRDVLPRGGDLVAFLSDRVEHEVLPATRPRWSVAAWLTRDDPASPGRVLPSDSSP